MQAPFQLQGLDHLVLRTGDVDRLVSFYQSLGCEVVREVERMNMVQLRAGTSMIDIIGGTDGDPTHPSRNLDHFALRVEPFDQDALQAFCETQGVEATFMPKLLGADGYGPAVYIADPDGNRVELKGPPLPDQD